MRFMMLMIPQGYETAAPGTVPPAESSRPLILLQVIVRFAGDGRPSSCTVPASDAVHGARETVGVGNSARSFV